MALNGLFCADVPLRNYSLTHSRIQLALRHHISEYCFWRYSSFKPVLVLPDRSIVLRSATRSDLQVPRTCLKFGEHAFSMVAIKARNDQPLHLRAINNTDAFKWRPKTFLSCKFYDLEYPSDFMQT